MPYFWVGEFSLGKVCRRSGLSMNSFGNSYPSARFNANVPEKSRTVAKGFSVAMVELPSKWDPFSCSFVQLSKQDDSGMEKNPSSFPCLKNCTSSSNPVTVPWHSTVRKEEPRGPLGRNVPDDGCRKMIGTPTWGECYENSKSDQICPFIFTIFVILSRGHMEYFMYFFCPSFVWGWFFEAAPFMLDIAPAFVAWPLT